VPWNNERRTLSTLYSAALSLAEQVRGLERSVLPTAVFDFDHRRYRWANAAALVFWRADSEAELLARDFSGGPPSVQQRVNAAYQALCDGREVAEDWTLYPRGVPVPVRMVLSPVSLDDGRVAGLQQLVVQEPRRDPGLQRGIEALLHTSVLVALVRDDGGVLHQNPSSARTHPRGGLLDWFVDRGLGEALLREAVDGAVARRDARLRGPEGERWYSVEARPVRDPVTAVMSVLVQCTDQSARIDAERAVDELRAALDVVEAQRLQILSLSAPLIDVGDATLAVPIIGDLDAGRGAEIAGRLLPAIRERAARVVILDLTGLGTSHNADLAVLRRLIAAVRLLGADAAVTGIGPELARTLVAAGQGVDVQVYRSLAEGLAATRGHGGRAGV
jgi:rsbT co-antagonist protein RsbR